MRTILISTAATLALISGAAMADPGGNGGGNGGGNHKPAKHQSGGGQDRKGGGPQAKQQPRQQSKPDRPVKMQAERKVERTVERRVEKVRPAKQVEHRTTVNKNVVHINEHDKVNVKNGGKTVIREESRAVVRRDWDNDRRDFERVVYRDTRGREFRVPVSDRVRVVTEGRPFAWSRVNTRRVIDGCPPGLAKKYNGCMPPGLARANYAWNQPDWYYRDYDRDARYRYYDGYMLRLSPTNSIVSYLPLLGGALAVGQVWPSAYQPVALPNYYSSYYDLGPASGYRYYGDTIYRVDPQTAAITSIAALLTGNDITIGQPMPMGYDVYNVPYNWRTQYYDTPDALYRYSDGYIYQLDPTTRLVQAAIELIV